MMNKLKLAFLLLVLSLAATAKDSSSIVVEGKSKISAVPEMVQFSLQLSEKDQAYTQCSDRLLEQIQKIKTLFVANNIDTLLVKTHNFIIHEQTEYSQELRRQVPIGYEANSQLVIKQELDNPKTAVIYELIKNNFEVSLNIQFDLSDKQMENLKDELIQLAIHDAQKKANSLTNGLNVKLGKIKNVQYGEPNRVRTFAGGNYDLMMRSEIVSAKGMASFTTLTPANIEMQTSVVVSWAIKQ